MLGPGKELSSFLLPFQKYSKKATKARHGYSSTGLSEMGTVNNFSQVHCQDLLNVKDSALTKHL